MNAPRAKVSSSLTPAGTLPNLEAFCRTFEGGSFTEAARALGVTPQAASRAVARLEVSLGVRLFRRTTRSLAPTEAARAYYESCKTALAALARAEADLAPGRRAASGRVRLSAPTTYGHFRLLPSLGAFRARWPRIELDVQIQNRNVDFVRDGFDLAVRMGEPKESSLVARRLGSFALGVYASPRYLASRGVPAAAVDLAAHDCIGFVLPSTGRVLPWSFAHGETVVPPTPVKVLDDFLGAITLARAGVGLVQAYDFVVEREVREGSLVEVMPQLRGAARRFSLLYSPRAVEARAVRALVDFLVDAARPS